MKSSMREKYNLLIDKYNIEFAGEVDPDKWPTVFEKKFAEIRRLGLQEFSKYEASINADTALHPWREHTKRRAERIAILAGECRRAGQNEDGWRLKLESEILLRFTIEVAW